MKEKEYVDEGGAQFNIGLSTAMEIRRLLTLCNELAMRGKFEVWYNALLALEREVSPEMKDGDDKIIDPAREKAIAVLEEGNKSGKGNSRIYTELHNYEKAVREIIKKRGLGMPDKDDDDGL